MSKLGVFRDRFMYFCYVDENVGIGVMENVFIVMIDIYEDFK